ncbi:Hypothetical protein Rta_04656 [Ramlibacter tataouinensis TTB310]|uniref:Uncharacterized protein n=1 Tax=Ramlibacter tataouinensis (strain ATCC BAA-407 / DSM 14655 / LMG 21543 / TTB310) TaxID=365046 RepID=F5Y637_RAMTT|nr:Hypothetical protein Rta_04656 [Ramlibacter tataouinensis TTB310]
MLAVIFLRTPDLHWHARLLWVGGRPCNRRTASPPAGCPLPAKCRRPQQNCRLPPGSFVVQAEDHPSAPHRRTPPWPSK